MDWGFVKVLDDAGNEYQAACFALCCHHCGHMFIEFFPNAKQENLFIGMIRAFQYMGIPEYILTDNMKSVVDHRDVSGKPVWNREYEAFMNTLCFKTKLCKPRHPYTKGKVERLVRFVKGNFLAGRTFWNVTDLNQQALEWCDKQNGSFHKGLASPRKPSCTPVLSISTGLMIRWRCGGISALPGKSLLTGLSTMKAAVLVFRISMLVNTPGFPVKAALCTSIRRIFATC